MLELVLQIRYRNCFNFVFIGLLTLFMFRCPGSSGGGDSEMLPPEPTSSRVLFSAPDDLADISLTEESLSAAEAELTIVAENLPGNGATVDLTFLITPTSFRSMFDGDFSVANAADITVPLMPDEDEAYRIIDLPVVDGSVIWSMALMNGVDAGRQSEQFYITITDAVFKNSDGTVSTEHTIAPDPLRSRALVTVLEATAILSWFDERAGAFVENGVNRAVNSQTYELSVMKLAITSIPSRVGEMTVSYEVGSGGSHATIGQDYLLRVNKAILTLESAGSEPGNLVFIDPISGDRNAIDAASGTVTIPRSQFTDDTYTMIVDITFVNDNFLEDTESIEVTITDISFGPEAVSGEPEPSAPPLIVNSSLRALILDDEMPIVTPPQVDFSLVSQPALIDGPSDTQKSILENNADITADAGLRVAELTVTSIPSEATHIEVAYQISIPASLAFTGGTDTPGTLAFAALGADYDIRFDESGNFEDLQVFPGTQGRCNNPGPPHRTVACIIPNENTSADITVTDVAGGRGGIKWVLQGNLSIPTAGLTNSSYTMPIEVRLINDDLREVREEFIEIEIREVGFTTSNVLIDIARPVPSLLTLVIQEDDANAILSFVPLAESAGSLLPAGPETARIIRENDPTALGATGLRMATLQIENFPAAATAATVSYEVRIGTGFAEAGVDYDLRFGSTGAFNTFSSGIDADGRGSVMIPASGVQNGSYTLPIYVQLMDDGLDEPTEFLFLSITDIRFSGTDDGSSLGEISGSPLLLSILDEDPLEITALEFDELSLSDPDNPSETNVVETTTVTVHVTIGRTLGGLELPVSIPYQISGDGVTVDDIGFPEGGDTDGDDNVLTGRVTIPPGRNRGSFAIPILYDEITELNEMIYVGVGDTLSSITADGVAPLLIITTVDPLIDPLFLPVSFDLDSSRASFPLLIRNVHDDARDTVTVHLALGGTADIADYTLYYFGTELVVNPVTATTSFTQNRIPDTDPRRELVYPDSSSFVAFIELEPKAIGPRSRDESVEIRVEGIELADGREFPFEGDSPFPDILGLPAPIPVQRAVINQEGEVVPIVTLAFTYPPDLTNIVVGGGNFPIFTITAGNLPENAARVELTFSVSGVSAEDMFANDFRVEYPISRNSFSGPGPDHDAETLTPDALNRYTAIVQRNSESPSAFHWRMGLFPPSTDDDNDENFYISLESISLRDSDDVILQEETTAANSFGISSERGRIQVCQLSSGSTGSCN